MAISTKPGKGNRRRGVAKGRSGRPGQLNWREDREVLARVSLVADPSLSEQPLTVIHQVVNLSLERQGKEPVSEQTIRLDLKRAGELYQERIVNGGEARMRQLQQIWAKNWRAIGRTPEGPAIAPLLAIAIRCVEDMARLDGSWEAARQPVLMDAPSGEEFGPSPQELLERGEISQEAYRGFLLVLHRNSGGIGAAPAQALPEPSGEVLEAQAIPMGGSRPGSVRASTRRRDEPPLLPRMGDEVDGVVDWTPDE